MKEHCVPPFRFQGTHLNVIIYWLWNIKRKQGVTIPIYPIIVWFWGRLTWQGEKTSAFDPSSQFAVLRTCLFWEHVSKRQLRAAASGIPIAVFSFWWEWGVQCETVRYVLQYEKCDQVHLSSESKWQHLPSCTSEILTQSGRTSDYHPTPVNITNEAEKSKAPSNFSQSIWGSVNAGLSTFASARITKPQMQRWLRETPDQGAMSGVDKHPATAVSNWINHAHEGSGK